jgi:hypothetical protein
MRAQRRHREPDGLGAHPFHADLSRKDERCKTPDADKSTAAKERYELLSYADDKLRANPRSACLPRRHARRLAGRRRHHQRLVKSVIHVVSGASQLPELAGT